jgi:heme o synthase
MKTATTTLAPEAPPLAASRLADYLELTKPRVQVLVLFTVAAGAYLAARPALNVLLLLHTLIGTALVAAGASALNQWLERHSDGLMRRTENRPLPSGRLWSFEVLLIAVGWSLGGLAYLAVTTTPAAAVVAAVTFVSYVCVYTPLKRYTTLNTVIGAVPGALPPVIGWAAVRGSVDLPVLAVFLVIFLWQLPHFLAIAWIYREDYARAGMRMVPAGDATGLRTARTMVAWCLALVAGSLVPVFVAGAGPVYVVGAVVLGGVFLLATLGFWRRRTRQTALAVMRASLLYLPALLALLLLDGRF